MTFPRLAALSEIAWSPREARDWNGFLQRLAPQMQRYRKSGIAAADSAFAVRFDVEPESGGAKVALRNQTGFGELRYTLDGSEPGPASPRYEQPLTVPLATTVRANAFADGRPLALPRSQQITAESLATVDAEQLQTCSKDGLVLRLEDDEPAGDQRAVVPVDIGNPCWIWKDVDLTGVKSLRVEAVDLPFNFQFGADPLPGELRKQATRDGELEVSLDGCDGKRAGRAMLGDARRQNGAAVLDVPIGDVTGRHDLCLRFTRDRHDPFWAIDRVQLQLHKQ